MNKERGVVEKPTPWAELINKSEVYDSLVIYDYTCSWGAPMNLFAR
jgi:hypothetical protein